MQRESHKQTNKRVGKVLCNAFQRRFDVTVRLVTAGDQTGSPDAVIEVGGKSVVLELAGYRQRDEYHELEVRESQVRSALLDSLPRSGAPAYTMHINWKYEPRLNVALGISDRRARVPKGDEIGSFCEEFNRLVRFVSRNPTMLGKALCFKDAKTVAAFSRYMPDEPLVDKADYPTLAGFCSSITLDAWTHPGPPLIQTSFDARWVGTDFGEIERVVGNKLNKLANYRTEAQGKEVWLVLYTDGMPPSTWTDEAERDDVLKKIRETIARSSDQFDQVWWAEDTCLRNEAKIWGPM